MIRDVMVKHCKDFFRQGPLLIIVRLALLVISLWGTAMSLRDFIGYSRQGRWFPVELISLAVLANVAAVLINLGIMQFPFRRRKVHVEVRLASFPAYPPLPADHPLVTDEKERCCLCEQRFKVGEITTLVSKERSVKGTTAEALPAHAECVAMAMTQGKFP